MEMIFGQLCFTESQNNSLPQLRVHLMSALECVVHCEGVGVKKKNKKKNKRKVQNVLHVQFQTEYSTMLGNYFIQYYLCKKKRKKVRYTVICSLTVKILGQIIIDALRL